MIVYFSKDKDYDIYENNVNAIDIHTDNFVIRIRKSGIDIDQVEISADGKRTLASIYSGAFNLT